MELKNLINYYYDCYRADNRELTLFNFLHSSIENKITIEGKEELLTGDAPIIPIDSELAVDILKKLDIYQKEKELIYASFFVCGQYTNTNGKLVDLCSPLFYYPAEISQNGDYHYLSIDPEARIINYPTFKFLDKENSDIDLDDNAFKDLPAGLITFSQIHNIDAIFKKFFPSVNSDELFNYPSLQALSGIKRTVTEQKKLNTLKIIPSSMLGIIEKSSSSRGILNELKELADQKDYSLPLQNLFLNNKIKESKYKTSHLPYTLSQAQQQLLISSATNPLTLIVGPPGTGKSYTIASIAADHLSRGESVLISSRTDEAVDVIKNKIAEQIGCEHLALRAGKRRKYATPTSQLLKAIITRLNTQDLLKEKFNLSIKRLYSIESSFAEHSKKIEKETKQLRSWKKKIEKRIFKEENYSPLLSNSSYGIIQRLQLLFFKIQLNWQKDFNKLFKDFNALEAQHIENVKTYLRLKSAKNIAIVKKNRWQSLKNFRQALLEKSDTVKIKKLQALDFNVIKQAFPIWLAPLSELKDVIPFKKELFDVAIIDEATQCDIASCLALFQRAKRVVIAGDPNQLKHISFLSQARQTLFKEKHELQNISADFLNYRNNSILDLTIDALQTEGQVAMLDEHFRSKAPIIAFSNQHFYDGALRIMTSRPHSNEPSISIHKINGSRTKQGYNTEEAEAIINKVKKIINDESSAEANATTIGILSPFRDQSEYIGNRVIKDFSISEIEKHKIKVGTAYSFQGEERDEMFLSMAIDKNSHHSAWGHLNKRDVFNVAITRAKKHQHVYTSISQTELDATSLLNQYLSKVTEFKESKTTTNHEKDSFIQIIINLLKELRIENYWINYTVAGIQLDILLYHKDEYIAFDLIGHQGAFEQALSLNEYKILKRAGINIHPLLYSDWLFNKSTFTAYLRNLLK